jgi:outer membrane protein
MFHRSGNTAARRHTRRALAATLLLVPSALFAQGTPPTSLSIEQAVQLARENNPTFLQQKNNVDVSRSAVRAAVGGLLPTANISNGYGYTAGGTRRAESVVLAQQPGYYSGDYSLGVNYRLSGSSILEPSLQRSQKRAVERQVAGSAADLAGRVSQQYLTVLQAREQVAQAEKELARLNEYVKLAQAKLDVGSGTPLEVRSAEVESGTAEVALIRARNDAATAAITLGQLIGVPLEAEVELTSKFTIFQPTWNAQDLVSTALQTNPTLLAANASESAAETQVKSARSAYLPTLGFNVGWRGSVYQASDINPLVASSLQQTGQAFQSCQQGNALAELLNQPARDCSQLDVNNPAVEARIRDQLRDENSGFPFGYTRQPMSAGITISLPLFQGFSRQLQVDQAKAAAADARYQVRSEELRLRQEVSTGLRNLQTAYQTALLDDKVRQNAEEQLRLAQERFRFGAANSIEVTDAQAKLSKAEQDQINAIYDFHKSLAALEALVGRPLR